MSLGISHQTRMVNVLLTWPPYSLTGDSSTQCGYNPPPFAQGVQKVTYTSTPFNFFTIVNTSNWTQGG